MKTFLFDWDGTLLDSYAAGRTAMIHVLAKHGYPVDEETYDRQYSPDWTRYYQHYSIPATLWEQLNSEWRNTYTCFPTTLFTDTECLKQYASSAILGLITSGERARVIDELDQHDLTSAFYTIICGDDSPHKKPSRRSFILP